MQLRAKVCIPIAAITLAIGVCCYFIIQKQFESLNDTNIQNLVEAKSSQMQQAIELCSEQAMRMAALMSRMPEVEEAYKKAMEGDINDENSAASQQGREMLRKSLAPMLEGFTAVIGEKPQIHYHLPPARSFARLWRDKQTKKGDKWVDISDDLTAFRPTVLDVNKNGKALCGVEIGSGGFEIRGLAPVTGVAGNRLGSVEVLVSFTHVLEGLNSGAGQSSLLYMNLEHLKFATGLQNKDKNPIVADSYVLVRGSKEGKAEALMDKAFLDATRKGSTTKIVGSTLISGMPITDYKDKQIGVLVFTTDLTEQQDIMSRAGIIITATFLTLLVVPLVMTFFVLSILVLKPVQRIRQTIQEIAEDRAVLANRLQYRSGDEIGALASWFNKLLDKIESMLTEVQGYKNLLNAVPDPIFGVDDEYRIIIANTATETLLKKDIDKLRGQFCHDNFNTAVCQTADCPIAQSKLSNSFIQAGIIDIGTEEKPHFVQPVSDVLRDDQGNKIGYVEIARDVTSLVLKEREIEKTMKHMREVNASIAQASHSLAEATELMSNRFQKVNEGADAQNHRAQETATAMEEMTSTVHEVAQNAASAADQTEGARQKAQAGASVVDEAIAAIAEVNSHTSELLKEMESLETHTQGIGRILGVISDIADQTNLLALNAAIEAARAGDAGRGFAVVADEVRKLAEKTMLATKEVAEAVTAIQSVARGNMQEMRTTVDTVNRATDMAHQSGTALTEIVEIVGNASSSVQSIATAAEQQSATSEEINRAIVDVKLVAESTHMLTRELNTTVAELSHLADQLKRLSQS